MSQTSYVVDPALAFRGMLEDVNKSRYIRSYANGDAAAVGFGLLVRADATNPEEQFQNFSATSQVPLGVTVHQQAQQDPSLAGTGAVALLETVGILRQGRIWVFVEEAISVGDAVFFRHTAGGGGSEIGAFRTDADTATADQLVQAQWLRGSTPQNVALLEFAIPS
ncbi:MAG: hypothetical protein MJA83_05575 [Gammaproteobacteria bacterium]|nr:hypothetical protein [Gammaproteobacteria bacterium]